VPALASMIHAMGRLEDVFNPAFGEILHTIAEENTSALQKAIKTCRTLESQMNTLKTGSALLLGKLAQFHDHSSDYRADFPDLAIARLDHFLTTELSFPEWPGFEPGERPADEILTSQSAAEPPVNEVQPQWMVLPAPMASIEHMKKTTEASAQTCAVDIPAASPAAPHSRKKNRKISSMFPQMKAVSRTALLEQVPSSNSGVVNHLEMKEVDLMPVRRITPMSSDMTESHATSAVLRWVRSHNFDMFIGFFISANALFIGVQADLKARNPLDPDGGDAIPIIETAFVYLFLAELVLKVLAFGRAFCRSKDWCWNMFDVFIVAVGLFDDIITRVASGSSNMKSLNFLRIMRIMGIVSTIQKS